MCDPLAQEMFDLLQLDGASIGYAILRAAEVSYGVCIFHQLVGDVVSQKDARHPDAAVKSEVQTHECVF